MGQIPEVDAEGSREGSMNKKEKTMENTCKTCINNDDGLCDRKGILVEDEDSCEHHWAAGKKIRMKRHEKKMDITPELALAAYNTLIQFCRGQPASADGTCDNCILYQHCPGITNLLAMCGKTIGSFRRNVLFWLKLMLRSRGYSITDHRADNLLTIRKDGKENYFYIFGGKDERSQDLIQGITLAGVFFDEVALMPESFVNQALEF